MKGYRFYLEYPDEKSKLRSTVKHPGKHSGTVIALLLDKHGKPLWIPGTQNADAICSVNKKPNSPVCSGSVGVFCYLAKRCRRIPESLARKIHPRLFYYLEQ